MEDTIPEELIFDKAEEAEKLDQLRKEHDDLLAKEKELEAGIKASDENHKEQLEKKRGQCKNRINAIVRILDHAKKEKQG